MHARYYNQHAVWFMSVDPARRSRALINPQLYNYYSYGLSNPMNYLDPGGLRHYEPLSWRSSTPSRRLPIFRGCFSSRGVCRRMNRPTILALVASVILLTLACGSGFRYRPTNLRPVDGRAWTVEMRGATFRAAELVGLEYDTDISVSFELTNRSDETVVIERALFEAAAGRYDAEFAGDGEVRWRSVGPNRAGSISVFWSFDRSVTDVLGQRPTLRVVLRADEVQHEIVIEYQLVT